MNLVSNEIFIDFVVLAQMPDKCCWLHRAMGGLWLSSQQWNRQAYVALLFDRTTKSQSSC